MKCCRGDRALYGIHPCEFSRSVSVPHDGAEAPFGSAAVISAHSAAELMGEILNRMGLPYAQPSSGLQDTPGWRPLLFSVGFSSHTTFGVRQRQRSCRCRLSFSTSRGGASAARPSLRAVLMGNRIARESLALFAEMPIEEVRRDDRFAGVLATVGADSEEFEWAVAF